MVLSTVATPLKIEHTLLAKVAPGTGYLDLPSAEFLTLGVGGLLALGVAVYGALLAANLLEADGTKRWRLAAAGCLGASLALAWGWLLGAGFTWGRIALPAAFYCAAPLVGCGFAALPPWLIARRAARGRRPFQA